MNQRVSFNQPSVAKFREDMLLNGTWPVGTTASLFQRLEFKAFFLKNKRGFEIQDKTSIWDFMRWAQSKFPKNSTTDLVVLGTSKGTTKAFPVKRDDISYFKTTFPTEKMGHWRVSKNMALVKFEQAEHPTEKFLFHHGFLVKMSKDKDGKNKVSYASVFQQSGSLSQEEADAVFKLKKDFKNPALKVFRGMTDIMTVELVYNMTVWKDMFPGVSMTEEQVRDLAQKTVKDPWVSRELTDRAFIRKYERE